MLDSFELTSKDGTQKLSLINGRLHFSSDQRSVNVPLELCVIVLENKDSIRNSCLFAVYITTKTTSSIGINVSLIEAQNCLEEK